MKIATLQECEQVLGEPASTWAGRCFEIASKIVDAKLIELPAVAVYGHWIGPIHPKSQFATRRNLGFTQHGWIWIEDLGMVVDPTRFVFEHRAPYIFADYEPDESTARCKHCLMLRCEHDFLGANDECNLYEREIWPYDEGGNQWREAIAGHKPAPKCQVGAKYFIVKLDEDTAAFVAALLGQPDVRKLTMEQLIWLGNLPYQKLGRHVAAIYTAICNAGESVGESYFIEFIPIDNRKKAAREAGFKEK